MSSVSSAVYINGSVIGVYGKARFICRCCGIGYLVHGRGEEELVEVLSGEYLSALLLLPVQDPVQGSS